MKRILKIIGILALAMGGSAVMLAMIIYIALLYEAHAADVTYKSGGGSTMRLADQGDGTHAKVVTGRQQFLSTHDASGVSEDTYYVLLDLSDTTNWPHTETTDLIITGGIIRLNADAVGFRIHMGPVLDITANTMTVRWMATVYLDAATNSGKLAFQIPGAGVDTDDIMSADVAITAVTTGTSIGSPNGGISVGVGDIVVFADEVTGSSTAKWSAGVFYWTK